MDSIFFPFCAPNRISKVHFTNRYLFHTRVFTLRLYDTLFEMLNCQIIVEINRNGFWASPLVRERERDETASSLRN